MKMPIPFTVICQPRSSAIEISGKIANAIKATANHRPDRLRRLDGLIMIASRALPAIKSSLRSSPAKPVGRHNNKPMNNTNNKTGVHVALSA